MATRSGPRTPHRHPCFPPGPRGSAVTPGPLCRLVTPRLHTQTPSNRPPGGRRSRTSEPAVVMGGGAVGKHVAGQRGPQRRSWPAFLRAALAHRPGSKPPAPDLGNCHHPTFFSLLPYDVFSGEQPKLSFLLEDRQRDLAVAPHLPQSDPRGSLPGPPTALSSPSRHAYCKLPTGSPRLPPLSPCDSGHCELGRTGLSDTHNPPPGQRPPRSGAQPEVAASHVTWTYFGFNTPISAEIIFQTRIVSDEVKCCFWTLRHHDSTFLAKNADYFHGVLS